MTDREAIESLIYTYAERIDAGDFEGVADLFAHGRVVAAGDYVRAGREQVLEMYAATTRRYEDGTPRTKHVTTNVLVDVNATAGTASARSYFTVFQALADFPLQAIVAGRYQDGFENAGGVWRFVERRIAVDLLGDLSRHLTFSFS